MTAIAHLTLNSGDLRISPRTEVAEEIIDAFAGVIEHGHGASGIPGYDVRITHADGANAWIFDLHRADNPSCTVVICGLAADRDAAEKLWPMISTPITPVARPNSFEVTMPDSLPWLASQIIFPAPAETMHMVGDFERCLAWALLEHPFDFGISAPLLVRV